MGKYVNIMLDEEVYDQLSHISKIKGKTTDEFLSDVIGDLYRKHVIETIPVRGRLK